MRLLPHLAEVKNSPILNSQVINMSSVLRMIFVAVFLTTSAGCTTNPATGETEFNSTAVGAVVGGLAGGAIGIALGNGDAALAGAAIGAAVGGGTGYWWGNKQDELKSSLKGTGLDVQASTDKESGKTVLTVSAPADITFETGSSALKGGAFSGLSRLASSLRDQPDLVVTISGHTDSVGSFDSNARLSEQRAQAVAQYLYVAGVSPASVTTIGKGYSLPVASNDSAEGRAKNRRVEIQISHQ